jgi:transcriptional regulator with PAS, ATPase and Fis domain
MSADISRIGLLEAAGRGAVLLDEIGELPLAMQVKLLRALQEREIRVGGGVSRVRLEFRVWAATIRDLAAMVREGTFRQDLYYRLNVVQLEIPPLRQRKDDIPVWAQAFIKKHQRAPERVQISDVAMQALTTYNWPGNVRELESAILRGLAFRSGSLIVLWDLPFHAKEIAGAPDEVPLVSMNDLELRAIDRDLKETAGDKLAAARILGIDKTTLYRKSKERPGSHKRFEMDTVETSAIAG